MILNWQTNIENVSIHLSPKINLRQVKSLYCKNLLSNLNLAGLGHPLFCAGRSGSSLIAFQVCVLSALIMALTNSSQGSSGGSSPHPGASKEAHSCGLTLSEVLSVSDVQPLLSPAPWGCLDWLWTRAPGVLSGMDPSGCMRLLALTSVSLLLPLLAVLAGGTQNLFHC